MKKILIISIVLIAGCGYLQEMEIKETRNNLKKLQIGMSKEQVREIAGEPFQTKAKANTEIWLYCTHYRPIPFGNGYRTYEIMKTPLLFEDDKLVSWGQGIADKEDVDKYELRIR